MSKTTLSARDRTARLVQASDHMLRLILAGSLTLAGCTGSLPTPDEARHPASAFTDVPYPPPAALAETVPAPPSAELVWVDGEWIYLNDAYVWRRGGWVRPPRGASFAPWAARYLRDGRMQLATGAWYDETGKPLPYREPAVAAATPPNERTSEFGVGR